MQSFPQLVSALIVGSAASLSAFSNFGSAQSTDLVGTLRRVGELSSLVGALEVANLLDDLRAPSGPFTIFAPLNSAFERLPANVVDNLFPEDGGNDLLAEILLYHVVPGIVMREDIEDGMMLDTLGLDPLSFELVNNSVLINDRQATVVAANVRASNGVVHLLRTVLIPDSALNLLPGTNENNTTVPDVDFPVLEGNVTDLEDDSAELEGNTTVLDVESTDLDFNSTDLEDDFTESELNSTLLEFESADLDFNSTDLDFNSTELDDNSTMMDFDFFDEDNDTNSTFESGDI